VSGDHIMVTFQNGEIHELKITGGVEGKYYPENLVQTNESNFNLPGFNWRADRPSLSIPVSHENNTVREVRPYE
jgi:hypothetical protein